MDKNKSDKLLNVILGLIYILLILPMAYSMYNSVPACDDFSFGSKTISDNVLLNAIGYAAWNWKNHSGRWLTFFLQNLINPLNIQRHMGRFYGICDIVVFLLVFAVMLYSFRIILSKILELDAKQVKVVTFLIIAVLFTTYYYSEAYNWYIGSTAYTVPFALLLLTIAFTIRYEETLEKKYYIGLILSGLIPATNEFMDVLIGVLYLYVVFGIFRLNLKDKKRLINRLIPLLVFVIGGISCVFAPGNFSRQDSYDVQPSALMSAKQIVIDIIVRLKDMVAHHPLAIIIFVSLVLFGIKAGKMSGKNNIIVTAILTFIVVFGAVFPYVYGRAMTTTYLDVRMQYLFDYIIIMGISIGCVRFGRLISPKCAGMLDGKRKFVVYGIFGVLSIIALIYNSNYSKIVQIDIIDKRELIAESYDYWNGIILEIENSNEYDVVITRESEPAWTPYFLYVGLVEEDVYNLPLDEIFSNDIIMPNVYYKKASIRYVIED